MTRAGNDAGMDAMPDDDHHQGPEESTDDFADLFDEDSDPALLAVLGATAQRLSEPPNDLTAHRHLTAVHHALAAMLDARPSAAQRAPVQIDEVVGTALPMPNEGADPSGPVAAERSRERGVGASDGRAEPDQTEAGTTADGEVPPQRPEPFDQPDGDRLQGNHGQHAGF